MGCSHCHRKPWLQECHVVCHTVSSVRKMNVGVQFATLPVSLGFQISQTTLKSTLHPPASTSRVQGLQMWAQLLFLFSLSLNLSADGVIHIQEVSLFNWISLEIPSQIQPRYASYEIQNPSELTRRINQLIKRGKGGEGAAGSISTTGRPRTEAMVASSSILFFPWVNILDKVSASQTCLLHVGY